MKKKTITLGFQDNPTVTLLRGHVGSREFNRAHKEEWDGDSVRNDDLSHEFWIEQKRGWKKSSEGTKDSKGRKAQPVTVLHW